MNNDIKPDILALFMQMPCAECGKKPCHACYIKPLEYGGSAEYFNYIPLCVKHCCDQMKIGTIAMSNKYRNVKKYIENKGWTFGKKLSHKDLKEET